MVRAWPDRGRPAGRIARGPPDGSGRRFAPGMPYDRM